MCKQDCCHSMHHAYYSSLAIRWWSCIHTELASHVIFINTFFLPLSLSPSSPSLHSPVVVVIQYGRLLPLQAAKHCHYIISSPCSLSHSSSPSMCMCVCVMAYVCGAGNTAKPHTHTHHHKTHPHP